METVYHEPSKSLVTLTDEKIKEIKVKGTQSEYFKILTLPEHFSPQQLQDIVDGKLKENKYLVEVDCGRNEQCSCESNNDCLLKVIKLNPHITIYPVEENKGDIIVPNVFNEKNRILSRAMTFISEEESKIGREIFQELGSLMDTVEEKMYTRKEVDSLIEFIRQPFEYNVRQSILRKKKEYFEKKLKS